MNAHPAIRPTIRCAIYTRKSTEEGLDQDFNSLDAQHEACASYVASQKHEGWKLVRNRYDDGGISGGTLERPGLQRLLDDMTAGRIGMIVVYKIDRLTRSLADFARLVEQFDESGCSFVSVTQAFNTSTSMGRLTLNVLLSFAQFEREVTAERIRDKIAASKKKGLWMGGKVPLGYDPDPDPMVRGLVINRQEAKTVRTIFDLYDRTSNIRAVRDQAEKLGIRSKKRTYRNGQPYGGSILTRGQIHFVLTNPVYIGRIRHKQQSYPGNHKAIIDQDLWDRVQEKLQASSARKRGNNGTGNPAATASHLAGLFRDETGDRLTPSHANARGKRHRYYISNRLVTGKGVKDPSGWRLPATELETTTARIVADHLDALIKRQAILTTPDAARAGTIAGHVKALIDKLREGDSDLLRSLIAGGQIGQGEIAIQVDRDTLADAIAVPAADIDPAALIVTAPFQLKRRGVEGKIIAGEPLPQPDKVLITALARAHRWVGQIRSGNSITEIATSEGRSPSRIRSQMNLAFLSPAIQAAILNGTQPPDLTIRRILKAGIPLDWDEQMQQLGFAGPFSA